MRWSSQPVRLLSLLLLLGYAAVHVPQLSADAKVPDAKVPDAEVPDAEVPDASAPLVFLSHQPGLLSETGPTTDLGPLKEGHATIAWSEDPDAAGYRLHNSDGETIYAGRFARAFVSGLPDGEHSFTVVSVDETGAVLAGGPAALRVTVRHWSFAMAWTLFVLGAVVMLSLVVVLAIGTVREEAVSAGTEAPRE